MADEVKTGDLVPTGNQELTTEVRPDFIPQGTTGMEHLTRDDIQMPRLSLAQQMSPELVEGDPKFIEGLKIGDLFNNLTKQKYGVGPLSFTVVRADKPRYVEFIPRDAGGGIRDPNVPANDPRTQFGPNGELPLATKFYDFVIMLLPSRELVALSFKSTGLKVAKQLNGLIAVRNAPMYAGVYQVISVMTSNAKGRFAIYSVKNAGWVTDKPLFEHARGIHENLAGKTLVIEHDPEDIAFDPEELERASNAAKNVTPGATEGM